MLHCSLCFETAGIAKACCKIKRPLHGFVCRSARCVAEILRGQVHLLYEEADAAAAALLACTDEDVQQVADNVQLLLHLAPHSCLPKLKRLVRQKPQVLSCPLESWSAFLTAYGVSEQAFLHLLWHQPDVIIHSNPYAAGRVILALRSFGLSNRNINNTVLARVPEVLLLDEQQHLMCLHEFLSHHGLSRQRFRDLLAASPEVLLQDVATVLVPRLAFFKQELGARDEDIMLMLQQAPGLLLMSDTAFYIQPRLKLLQQCGFSKQQLLQLIAADTSLLTNSLPTLQRKWQYLCQELGLTADDVLRDCPSYFSKNLLLDVASRHAYITARGLLHMIGQVPGRASADAGNAASAGTDLPSHCSHGGSSSTSSSNSISLHLAAAGAAEPCMAVFSELHGVPMDGRQDASASQLFCDNLQQHIPQQQQQQQLLPAGHMLQSCNQRKQQQQVHLGRLLDCSILEFLRQLGPAADSADYMQFVTQWSAKEGLKWTAVRAH